MIKVDIVSEVSKAANITKVKAEVAVDSVFDAASASFKLNLASGVSAATQELARKYGSRPAVRSVSSLVNTFRTSPSDSPGIVLVVV